MQIIRSIAATTLLSVISTVLVAQISVSPLRLDLNNQSSVTSLTIFNKGNDQSTLQIQASVKSWAQSNGKDVYKDQNSILLLPPIFGIPQGQLQVVRIALLQPNNTNLEQTYRVFLNQFNPQVVNVQDANKINTNLSILLDVSIPIFVAPTAPKKISATWSLGQEKKQLLPLTITNTGNTHIHFAKVTLTNSSGTTVAQGELPLYVLAGSSMTDLLQATKPLQKGQAYTVTAITDDPNYPKLTGQVIP